MLFGREWKPCDKHQTSFFEAMALNAIAEEIMKEDTTATLYTDNGSSRSGVGSYVLQSLTINGEQYALPTFDIFTELRKSLAELEATISKILSEASFHRYSERDIFSQVVFVITDNTSHSLEVTESVCGKV